MIPTARFQIFRTQSLALVLVLMILFFNSFMLTGHALASIAEPRIHFTTLASGQQVYVQEIHAQPIVTIDTWVNTGSAQESDENNGVSHFLEHLLFKGTNRYKVGEIDQILESRGADFNAATSQDFTHYHITTASPYFKEALELHADMLLNATIPEPELDRERKVVQEEINRSLDSPLRKAYLTLSRLLYGDHPYALDTLGPKANIQNLSRKAILDYYYHWYQPENFKTIVVGDIDADEAVDWVNQAFNKAYLSQGRPEPGQPKLASPKPIAKQKSEVIADTNLSAVQLNVGFLAPSISNREENYALDIAAMILGKGSSSRLYQRIKEDRQLVNEVRAGNGTQQQAGLFYIGAELKPENRETAKKAILEEIARFKQEGPSSEEMNKAKTQVIKEFAFMTESTEGVAESIGYNVTIGTLEDYTQYVQNIQKITAQQVQEAARKYLDFDKAILVEVVPGDKTASLADQNVSNVALLQSMSRSVASNRETAQSGPEKSEDVSKIVLPNGATLLLKASPATKTLAISLFAKGGRLLEAKPGVAELTSRVWMKGTENRSAKELSQTLEQLGLSLSVSSAEDYLQLNAASVSEDSDRLLFILEDLLLNPAFSKEEIDKERANLLEEIRTNRDAPSKLMFEKLTEALYPQHPYGAVGERVEASLPGLTRDDLLAFYRQTLRSENLVVAVVGNFDSERMRVNLQQILAKIPRQEKSVITKYPDVLPLREEVRVDAQKPEQAASWIAYGWLAPGISRSNDYVALKVVNTLLGAGLSSRLFVNLREKQGLAYHVSSIYPSALKQSRFVMYIGTDPANREKVERGFDAEIASLQKEPVSLEELERVKSKLIGTFALAHESNASQAFYLGLYETLGVGYRFDTQFPELVRQITPEDIARVTQNYFNRPKVVAVVAPKVVRGETSAHEN